MTDVEILILGVVMALSSGILLKLESLLHPDGGNEIKGISCVLIYLTGCALGVVGVIRVFS